jgi:flagellar basal-body rod protein FlgF
MSDGIWSALSGAVGQLAVLDNAANNVANAGSPGFRADHAMFREVLSRAQVRGRGAAAANRAQWKNVRYAAVDVVAHDTTSGAFVQTGRPLDCAIRGDGFFAVKTTQGVRYTRLGATKISADGTLTTKDGDPYLGVNGKPIKVPPSGSDAAIGPDGTVRAAGATAGTLAMFRFQNAAQLEKTGALLFQPSASSGAATKADATLETSTLEQSNVSAVKGMVDIVAATRGFDACERAIDAFKEADRRAAMSLMGTT